MPPKKKSATTTRRDRESETQQESDTTSNSTMLKTKATIQTYERNDLHTKLILSPEVIEIKPIFRKEPSVLAAWGCVYSHNPHKNNNNNNNDNKEISEESAADNDNYDDDPFLALSYVNTCVAVYRYSTSETVTFNLQHGLINVVFSKNNQYIYALHASHLSVLEIKKSIHHRSSHSEEEKSFSIELVTTLKNISGIPHLPITQLALSPDGRRLCVGFYRPYLNLYDVTPGTPAEREPTLTRSFEEMNVSGEEKAQANNNNNDDDDENRPSATGNSLRYIQQMIFSPDGKSLFGVGTCSYIFSWDVETGRLNRPRLNLYPASVFREIEQKGMTRKYLTHSEERSGADGSCFFDNQPALTFLSSISLSSDGKTIAVACRASNHQVQLVDVEKWQRVPIETKIPQSLLASAPHDSWVEQVRFHPKEPTTLITCGFDFSLGVWNVETGFCISKIRFPNKAEVLCACFSPDGRHMCVCLAQRASVKLFQIERVE